MFISSLFYHFMLLILYLSRYYNLYICSSCLTTVPPFHHRFIVQSNTPNSFDSIYNRKCCFNSHCCRHLFFLFVVCFFFLFFCFYHCSFSNSISKSNLFPQLSLPPNTINKVRSDLKLFLLSQFSYQQMRKASR